MTSWPTSTTPERATAPLKPSTAESNTSAAPPYESETSSTTAPEHYWTPADSETKYTHFYDEPIIGATRNCIIGTQNGGNTKKSAPFLKPYGNPGSKCAGKIP